jgi:hypothetical protein
VLGIKQLRLESGYEVLIIGLRAIDAVVECARRLGGILQLLAIPFRVFASIGKGGNGIQTPVNEHAKAGLFKPGKSSFTLLGSFS